MKQSLPITLTTDGHFSDLLKPLITKLELWINFQALKADWYSNEDYALSFDFIIIRTLEEKSQQLTADNWSEETGYAYHFDSSNLSTIAFIAIDDISKKGIGIEKAIKDRLTTVANIIALKNGLLPLP